MLGQKTCAARRRLRPCVSGYASGESNCQKTCAARRRLRHWRAQGGHDGQNDQVRRPAPLEGDCDKCRFLGIRTGFGWWVRRPAPLEGDCDGYSLIVYRGLRIRVRRPAPLEGDCDDTTSAFTSARGERSEDLRRSKAIAT